MKNIIFHFKPIQIYIPWHMNAPDYIENDSTIQFSYPPMSFKPEKGFKKVITECLNWVRQNHDKSYRERIKSGYRNSFDDDATWQIRQLLGNSTPSEETSPRDNSAKWHLILHLAKEMESQLSEANRILHSLKNRPPLLDKSVERAVKTEYLLGDLYGFDRDSTLNQTRLSRMMEAWLGLFGGLIPENAIFFTSKPTIFNYILEQWNVEPGVGNLSNHKRVTFRLPSSSYSGSKEQGTNNKDNIFKEKPGKIKNLIYSIGKAPAKNIEALEKLSREYDTLLQGVPSHAFLRCTVKYLCPVPDEIDPKIGTYLRYLSNRTIILIEEE